MFYTRALLQAIKKTSTGLVGLEVNPRAREELIELYKETLKVVQIIPEDKKYREAVEQITKFRLSVVESNEEESVIEARINCGQLEELIEQAKDELTLIPKYAEWKLWEGPGEIEKDE